MKVFFFFIFDKVLYFPHSSLGRQVLALHKALNEDIVIGHSPMSRLVFNILFLNKCSKFKVISHECIIMPSNCTKRFATLIKIGAMIIINNFNILLLNNHSILFTSFAKFSEQYLGYYARYKLFNLKGSESKVTNKEILAQISVSVRLF